MTLRWLALILTFVLPLAGCPSTSSQDDDDSVPGDDDDATADDDDATADDDDATADDDDATADDDDATADDDDSVGDDDDSGADDDDSVGDDDDSGADDDDSVGDDDDSALADDDDSAADDDDSAATDDDDSAMADDDDSAMADDDDSAVAVVCTPEIEPNDDPLTEAQAAFAMGESTFCGSIDPAGDVDMWQIDVGVDGAVLTARTDLNLDGACNSSSSFVDTELFLLDDTGAVLDNNDDGGGSFCSLLTAVLEQGTYYLSVEHYNGTGTGPYQLDVLLELPESDCSDGVDNNSNGDIDCDDISCADVLPDCAVVGSACFTDTLTLAGPSDTYAGSLSSFDETDTGPQGTGFVLDDLEFEATAGEQQVIEITEATFDSVLFVMDQACVQVATDDNSAGGDRAQIVFTPTVDGIYTVVVTTAVAAALGDYTVVLNTEVVCDDSVDNDLDGDIDCADTDCDGVGDCVELDCTDGVDDEGDGAIDCADTDCADDTACFEADCTDGVDNEFVPDGLIDCADPDCAADPTCFETDCTDGVDNEAIPDGLIDCADPDCGATSTCAPSEVEPNDSDADADANGAMELPLRINGTIDPATDEDWFALSLTADASIVASTNSEGCASGFDSKVWVFESDGSTLVGSADGYPCDTYTSPVLTAGSYYVVVAHWDFNNTGDYFLTVE